MADTGAPYFIPYVEPTDLVRDYPAADEASADAIAAALDGIPVLAGIGSNVVSVTKTNKFATSLLGGVFTSDIPGLVVTITPTSATSKILLIGSISGAGRVNVLVQVHRDGTQLLDYSGDADGDRTRVSARQAGVSDSTITSIPLLFLDNPGTTSAVTYTIRVAHTDVANVRGLFVNRQEREVDRNDARAAGPASTLTAIEVAA